MSLQVWLPLTKDLRQQGLSNVTVVNNGATYSSTGGKLGGCYSFDGTDDKLSYTPSVDGLEEFSITLWLCPTSNTSASSGAFFSIERDTYWQITFWSDKVGIRDNSIGWNGTRKDFSTGTYTPNVWTHIAITYNKGTLKIYRDGILLSTNSVGGTKLNTGINNARIGSAVQDGYYHGGKINDVRFYDNCLSAEEVKRISQGLVLHYPLNHAGFGPTNLLKNGFGELNQENWGNSNIYTDVPSDHAEIKKSYKDNESLEFIPLFRNSTYKFTGWVKAASSSGNSYPSLKPYDADKLFISTYHCREGFNLSTMTTLRQQLNPGDTKIYVDDLSAWNANSGHHYDVAAIFSYTDGQGYTWPDGMYTRNCPAFATGTNAKTNLDKTNNIITLLSAYTGPSMPVGTKLCASTYGSTYFYPWGGLTNSNIADWTYKEGTFSSENVRMECAKYIRVYAYSTCYQAGMTLTNLTADELNSNIEYDTSGYCNNGTKIGTLTYTSDAPKYSVSTDFNGTEKITSASLPSEVQTVAFWVKVSSIPSGYGICYVDSNTQTSIGFYNGNSFITSCAVSANVVLLGTTFKTNEWNHIVLIKTGTNTRDVYCNGVLLTNSGTNSWVHNGSKLSLGWRDYASGNAGWLNGQMCDFRAYSTALSADDVLDLYNKKI